MKRGERELEVTEEAAGQPLAGFLRSALGGSWAQARRLVETGKVFVDGRLVGVPPRLSSLEHTS
jgi:hypothetical protein